MLKHRLQTGDRSEAPMHVSQHITRAHFFAFFRFSSLRALNHVLTAQFSVDASTRTPIPIVEDTEILRRNTPFDDAGFDLFNASINAARLVFRRSTSNDARPIDACTIPALSARNRTCPAFAFFTACATSVVTVPTLGLGISPRGPSTWP